MRYRGGAGASVLVGFLAFGTAASAAPSVTRISYKAGAATAKSAKAGAATLKHRRRSGSGADAAAQGPVVSKERGRPKPALTGGDQPANRTKKRVARVLAPKQPCLHDAVQFERGFGGDLSPIVLTRCDGRAAPQAVEQLSILVRPMNAPRPSLPTTPVRNVPGAREWLPGVKLVDEGLVTRLQKVTDHFQKTKVTVVSGYRPRSLGSFHQSAKAIDFHLDGVAHEALVAFCRTLPDTGCGYYPNSSFVHMDVRPKSTGHVYWIDASGPGESPVYVSTWPPREGSVAKPRGIPKPDPAAPADEQTHESFPRLPPGASDTKVDARTIAPLGSGRTEDDPFRP
jgi:hypothetical protein